MLSVVVCMVDHSPWVVKMWVTGDMSTEDLFEVKKISSSHIIHISYIYIYICDDGDA